MITSHTYHSFNPWKNLIITGSVHGSEHCGPNAIAQIMKEIEQWIVTILKWSVTFIPICNPLWYQQKKRLIDENLARVFQKYETPLAYEHHCANIIAPYLDNSDVLLDVHSWDAKNSIFVFQDHEQQSYTDLINNLWFDLVIHGWNDMYPNDGAKDPSSYMADQWKTWVVVECGQHEDPQSTVVAYNALKNFMGYYGAIDHTIQYKADMVHVMMKKLTYMSKPWSFVKERKNGDPIQLWEHIATYDDGEKIFSDIEWYIVLPKNYAPLWKEWFYLAEKM